MKFLKGIKGTNQQGFTLIELLVVIAILAVLAAITIPAYSRFFGAGKDEAAAAELSHIQAAMDAMMANYRLTFVDAGGPTDVFDVSAGMALRSEIDDVEGTQGADGLLDNPKEATWELLYPAYLRLGYEGNETMCKYTWVASGWITQVPSPGYDSATGCGNQP